MARNFKEAIAHRRTYYTIADSSPVADNEIKAILEHAVTHVPSAFNSQSTRIVLLLADNHRAFWDLTKQALRAILSDEAYAATEAKIDNTFRCGYATILYYEDTDVVKGLQEAFATYADRFPVWSEHTSAMHQFAIWTMLEDAGFGVSLQHYNPLVDDAARARWNIPASWKLIAQMPFGTPTAAPGEKEQKPLEERLLVF